MKFKTNIKCGTCEAKVAPFLDKVAGQGNWAVDLQSPERILTLPDKIPASDVITALKEAGYIAEQL